MVQELTAAASDLAYAEAELAEARIRAKAGIVLPAIVLMAVGAVLGFIGLLALAYALGAWFATMMGTALAALLVALIGFGTGGVLLMFGKSRFSSRVSFRFPRFWRRA